MKICEISEKKKRSQMRDLVDNPNVSEPNFPLKKDMLINTEYNLLC